MQRPTVVILSKENRWRQICLYRLFVTRCYQLSFHMLLLKPERYYLLSYLTHFEWYVVLYQSWKWIQMKELTVIECRYVTKILECLKLFLAIRHILCPPEFIVQQQVLCRLTFNIWIEFLYKNQTERETFLT